MQCLSKCGSGPAASSPVRNADSQHPLHTTESETLGVGCRTVASKSPPGKLKPAASLETLMFSYTITSFPESFLALLCSCLEYMTLSSGIPVRKTNGPGFPGTFPVLPLKVLCFQKPLSSRQIRVGGFLVWTSLILGGSSSPALSCQPLCTLRVPQPKFRPWWAYSCLCKKTSSDSER